MKKDIHPKSFPTIFVDTSCGAEFVSTSTLKSDETREVKGETFQVIKLEISSASHPFYTGKQILVDTARRAEKYQEKMAKVGGVAAVRKGKKAKRVKATAAKKAKAETKTEPETSSK